jgi:hypothetical protein
VTPYQKVCKLYVKFLEDVYALLVTEAGADPDSKQTFMVYMLDPMGNQVKEYRFQGSFKGGGKLWMDNSKFWRGNSPYWVSCYPEHYAELGARVIYLNEKIEALYLGYATKSRELVP